MPLVTVVVFRCYGNYDTSFMLLSCQQPLLWIKNDICVSCASPGTRLPPTSWSMRSLVSLIPSLVASLAWSRRKPGSYRKRQIPQPLQRSSRSPFNRRHFTCHARLCNWCWSWSSNSSRQSRISHAFPVHDGGTHPHSLPLWLVLLCLSGWKLPSRLHKQQQSVFLQPAAASHHPSLRLLPPVELDGDQVIQTQLDCSVTYIKIAIIYTYIYFPKLLIVTVQDLTCVVGAFISSPSK